MVPVAIAGVSGMNFEVMPKLKWRYGYFAVLGGIFTACAIMYWQFRKNGWGWL